MSSFRITALLVLGTLVVACSGQSMDEPMNGSGTTGGSGGGCVLGLHCPGGGSGGLPGYPTGGGGSGGLPLPADTGGGPTDPCSTPGWCVPAGGGPSGGAPSGGAPPTGGYAGEPSSTGGLPGTGGSPDLVSYFDPAPEQPTDFSCCVIWAFCVGHPYDYRCTEATLQVTSSDRKDACDIWLQQVQDPIGAESIPACL